MRYTAPKIFLFQPRRQTVAARPSQPTSQTPAGSTAAQAAEAAKRAREEQERRRIAEIKKGAEITLQTVRDHLRDPDSAQFRNVWAMNLLLDAGGTAIIYCGEVNSRNGFGGYTGFEPFMGIGQALYSTKTSSVFEGMFRDYCTNGEPVMRGPL